MARIWYLLLALVVIIGILIFRFVIAPPEAKKNGTYLVKRETLKETLSLSGKIVADEDVTLRFQTSGRLSWVGVKEGDTVKKYQVVALLDPRETQKTLQKYLNTYMSTRWNFEQAVDDNKNRVVTDALKRTAEKAQFDLNSSVIDVELKALASEYSNLWSPIEGLVVKVDAPKAGVNITPTTAEFEIVNPKSVYFSATADQVDVVRLTASQSGQIILDAYPENTIHSRIESIAFVPKTDETGTVYEIRMNIPEDNSFYKFRLGMTGDVNFTLSESPNVLTVPQKYLKTERKTKYVFRKNSRGEKQKQTVTTGKTVETTVEITSGLTEGDIIYD